MRCGLNVFFYIGDRVRGPVKFLQGDKDLVVVFDC